MKKYYIDEKFVDLVQCNISRNTMMSGPRTVV